MKKIILTFFSMLAILVFQGIFPATAIAQAPQISAIVDSDTIALTDFLTLTVTFQNCDAQGFQLPEIANFQVIGRPSSQTSMSMINGKTTMSAAYTYILKPKKTGRFTIDKIGFKTADGKSLETDKMKVVVLEKYKNNSTRNQRKQVSPPAQLPFFEPPFGHFPQTPFEQSAPKPKRKTIQI